MPRFLSQTQFDEVLSSVPCRKPQAALLDSLFSARPPAILVHGPGSSGKSTLIQKVLDTSGAIYAWVDCEQCNTTRIMLQRAIRGVKRKLVDDLGKVASSTPAITEGTQTQETNGNGSTNGNTTDLITVEDTSMIIDVEQTSANNALASLKLRLPTTIVHGNTNFDVVTENISAFYSTLQIILDTAQYPQESKPIILVLDRVDQLYDNPSDVFSCFARVRELAPEIKALTTVFVTSTLEPKQLMITHVPHIRFTPYTINETIQILENWGNAEREVFLQERQAWKSENTDEGMYGYNGQDVLEYKKMVLKEVMGPHFGINKNLTSENIIDDTPLRKTHVCVLPQRIIMGDPTGAHQRRFWSRYCAMIVNALNSYTGSDIRLLKEICLRIWPAFIYPIVTGKAEITEFQALWRECRYIFQTEIAVHDLLIFKSLDPLANLDNPDADIDPSLAAGTNPNANGGIPLSPRKKPYNSKFTNNTQPPLKENDPLQLFREDTGYSNRSGLPVHASALKSQVPIRHVHRREILPLKPTLRDTNELPLQSKYIVIAAYLASYNPPRFDIRFFSRAKEARAKRRDTGRRKLLKINPRLLAAPAFDLERVLAILHAIAPSAGGGADSSAPAFGSNQSGLVNGKGNPYSEQNGGFPSNIDIGVQIATLTALRLIVCLNPSDPLDSKTRWKINVSWPLIKKLASEINLDLENYLIE